MSPVFFFDTSALTKLYHQEVGTERVETISGSCAIGPAQFNDLWYKTAEGQKLAEEGLVLFQLVPPKPDDCPLSGLLRLRPSRRSFETFGTALADWAAALDGEDRQ